MFAWYDVINGEEEKIYALNPTVFIRPQIFDVHYVIIKVMIAMIVKATISNVNSAQKDLTYAVH